MGTSNEHHRTALGRHLQDAIAERGNESATVEKAPVTGANEASQQLQKLREEFAKLKSDCALQNSQLTLKRSESDRAKASAVAELEKLKNELTQKNDELAQQVKVSERSAKKIKDLEDQLETLKTAKDHELQLKETEVSQLKEDVSHHKANNDDLLKQIQETKAKNDELTKELQQTKASRDLWTTRVLEADAKNKDFEIKISERDAKIGTMQEDYKSLMQRYSDPSVQHFLTAKAVKLYRDPGIEGAANKTYVYVVPSLRNRYEEGYKMLNSSHALVYEKLNSFIGTDNAINPWLPLASGILVYGSFLIPFFASVCCLLRIVFQMRVWLLFCHLYFVLVCVGAVMFALVVGKDPLTAFAAHDASVYLSAQILNGVLLTAYLTLILVSWCCNPKWDGKRLLQGVGIGSVVLAYYWYVWTPAMLDKMPQVDETVAALVGRRAWTSLMWLPYVPPLIVFTVALIMEITMSGPMQSKGQVSVDLRDVEELASLVGKEGVIELGTKTS
jgi:hypothetical protein